MANPLYNIPGLGGFVAQRENAAAQERGELQNAAGVLTLQAALQQQAALREKQQRMKMAEREFAQLGPNPPPEKVLDLIGRYGTPEMKLKAVEARNNITRALSKETLDHQYRMQNLQTDRDRLAETERHNRAMESLRATGGDSSYFTPVYGNEGVLSFNARTGTAAPLVVNGRQVVRSADDPTLQRNLSSASAGGRVEGESAARRQFNMSGIGQIIQRADDLLGGVRRDESGVTVPTNRPTQSGIGTLVDSAARFIGVSPTGAKEAQQLRALAGALTSKMPRMEGPQSDRDVQLYREMAAEVGDSNIPIEQRKSALETVKQLWAKYENLNPDAFAGGVPAAPGNAPRPGAPAAPGGLPRIASDAEFNALPSGAVFIAPDGSRRRKP